MKKSWRIWVFVQNGLEKVCSGWIRVKIRQTSVFDEVEVVLMLILAKLLSLAFPCITDKIFD